MDRDTDSPPPDLTMVIPCYFEAQHLVESVRELEATLADAPFTWELLFVEDASPDGTRRIVESLVAEHPGRRRAIYHEANRGRGQTVKDGILASGATYVGFIDIDLEVHPRYIPSMIRSLREGADVATGLRVYFRDWRSLVRDFSSWVYSLLIHSALDLRTVDSETGYKFFRRERILPVLERTRDPGWFWDTEVMYLAEAAGLRVEEIPVVYLRRPYLISTVRIFRDSWRYLISLRRFRRRLRAGL
ncbi:MAG: glycosyltransferase [Planctomycetes bacterium]|nr:glycosyltransferase [Planctomycetota bacterium]